MKLITFSLQHSKKSAWMAFPVRVILLSSICPLVFFTALFLLSFISLGLYLLFFFSTVFVCCCLLAFNLGPKQRASTLQIHTSSANTEVSVPSSSSISSPPSGKLTHDVFLSFRGPDTRANFTDSLYTALKQKGIFTFIDDGLQMGESIGPNLEKAIEESRYVIVVFSPNYADSAWCLDELAKAADCMNEMGQKVIPVFYHVDPFEVRRQKGKNFEKAFEKHQERYKGDPDKVKRWKDALFQVGNISGWHVQKEKDYESRVIQDIVQNIFTELNEQISISSEGLVGMDSHLNQMLTYMDIGCPDVRIIGICGMGGIGKTTIAHVVFKRVKAKFEGNSFLENVREVTEKQGAVHLQQQLILNLLNSNVHVQNSDMGKDIISLRLRTKKVLLVLDDVDEEEQLETLCHPTWFGPGSRIILTSRDEHLLTAFEANKVYKVNPLIEADAMKLFRMKAFRKDQLQLVGDDFLKLSKELLKYADGNPLAIKVLGSSVKGREAELWLSTLNKLKKSPGNKIYKVLKVSFDGLEETEKEMFLDIACFFRGGYIDQVTRILQGSDGLDINLQVLVEKSMVTLFGRKLGTHDLLQELAYEIVREECRGDPGKRSRLWLANEIMQVFRQSKGMSGVVQSIMLERPTEVEFDHSIDNAFSNMHRLRLLKISNVKFSKCIGYLSNNLQYLEWHKCPLDSFPRGFQPDKLVEVHMHSSLIKQLWTGKRGWSMLRHLDLRGSPFLISTPDFSDVPNLEVLVLQDCTSLVEVHPSLGSLNKLSYLDMELCKSIESLPPFTNLESLQILRLSDCSGLKKFPEISGNMKCLQELHVGGTSIEELPSSIQRLTGLTILNLIGCESLLYLPSTIGCLTSLKSLYLTGCSKIDQIPENLNGMKCLEKLAVDGTSITELSFIVGMNNLQYLSFQGCKCLVPESFKGLASLSNLIELELSYCNLMDGAFLNDFSSLISLKYLDLSGNLFVRLPENITQFAKLEILHLRNCRQLQLVPKELPAFLQYVSAEGCTSLTDYPDQIKVLNGGLTTLISHYSSALELSAINKKLVVEGKSTELISSHHYTDGSQVDHHLPMTEKYLQETFTWPIFTMLVPGDDVPEWFSTKSKRNPISMEIPDNLATDYEWKGFAACAIFAVEGHTALSLIEPDPEFSNYSYQITFETDVARLEPEVLRGSRNLASCSHLLIVYNLSSLTLKQRGLLNNSTVVRAIFETTNPSMVVQKCGIRLVYERDAGWYSIISLGFPPICLNKFGNHSVQDSQDTAWLNQSLKWEKIIPPLEEESTHVLRKNLQSVLPRYLEALKSCNAVYKFNLRGSPGWFHESFIAESRKDRAKMSCTLPQNLHKNKKWMGFATFASLVEDVGQKMKEDNYGIFVELGTGETFGTGVSQELKHVKPLSEEHHQLLIIYIPRAQIPEGLLTQTLLTKMDTHIMVDSPYVVVQRCGFRIVYGEDVQGFADTIIRCMQRENSIKSYDQLAVERWIRLLRLQGARLKRMTQTPLEKFFALHSPKYKNWDWSDHHPVVCDFEGAELFKSEWFLPFINPGNSAQIQLPLNVFDDDNWLGFAVCSLFSQHQSSNNSSLGSTDPPEIPESKDVGFNCRLDSDVSSHGLFDVKISGVVTLHGPVTYNATRFIFLPRSKCLGNTWRQCKLARVTMWFSRTCLAVHHCGLRLVFKEDIEHLVGTLIVSEFYSTPSQHVPSAQACMKNVDSGGKESQ